MRIMETCQSLAITALPKPADSDYASQQPSNCSTYTDSESERSLFPFHGRMRKDPAALVRVGLARYPIRYANRRSPDMIT